MFSRNNLYLSNFLLILVGIVCFIINAKRLADLPGLLTVSVILMVTPIINIFLSNDFSKVGKYGSLLLLLLPLFFLNYIFFIKMGSPVGYDDPHFHIYYYTQAFSENGKILFQNIQNISFNFVGLYIVFKFLVEICNENIVTTASLVPPLLNLLVVVLVYAVISRLHPHKIALLAAMFFGWETQTIIFGQEMRTQTIGIILLLSILVIIYRQKDSVNKSLSDMIALIILLLGVITASFVSIFFASVLIFMILATAKILNKLLNWPKISLDITWILLGMLLIFFLFYTLFIGKSFRTIMSTLKFLFEQMMAGTAASSATIEVPYLYGVFAKVATRIFWAIFLVSSVFYLLHIFKNKDTRRATFFMAFMSLLGFGLLDFIVGPLSFTRIYVVGFILIATVNSFGLGLIKKHLKKPSFKCCFRIFACTIILLFTISSTVKYPSYIIGETAPIRSKEPIDTVPYWDKNLPQYYIAKFLNSTATNRSIYLHTLEINYFLLQICNKNQLSIERSSDQRGRLVFHSISGRDLIVRHDKFNGQNYTYRNLLPDVNKYNQLNKIYSNRDYNIYGVS